MSSAFYLSVLSCIIVVSIFASGFANHRQQTRLKKRKLLQRLRKSADHFAQIAATITQFSTNKAIAAEFIGMAISNYQRILRLDMDSEHTQLSLQSAQQFAQQLGSGSINTLLQDDANTAINISNVKQQLNDACQIFKKMRDSGSLSNDSFKEYHQELIWLYLVVEVEAMIRHGDEAKERKDPLRSMSYYQSARNLLKKSAIADPRKQEKLDEIENLLSN